jgi:ATP-dependent Clp protease protease subunit
MTTPLQQVTQSELYAVFCGPIDGASAQRITQGIAAAMAQNVTHIHAIFQTSGGSVADGVFLYNYLRSLPIGLTLYNVGSVASIGVVAYQHPHLYAMRGSEMI